MNAAFDNLAQRLVKEHWDFYPTAGSRIGRHEYDGQLPDLSPHRIPRRTEELRRGLAQLSGLADGNGAEPEDRLTHRLLELFLRRELFNLEEMRPLENNPMRQVGYLNVGGYVKRDYAPLVDRLRSATQGMEQAPDFLQALDTALTADLSRPVLEMSIESYRGMARFYRVDLDQSASGVGDAETLAKFDQAREQAALALDGFATRLEERLWRLPDGKDGDFAIGPQLYADMLSYGEGVNVPLNDLISLGQANMERNLERLAEATAAVGPGRSIREIVGEIGRNHPSAEGLIPETRAMLEDIRQSLLDHDIISLPSEDRCQVIETPTYMRYAFAAMDSPGSLETQATESFYYVTPVEDSWTATQAEEWLTNFNYDTLRIVSIHEVYPGHFVHHLHNSYGRELPLVNRVASSYAFSEGWAHYTEEMMLETEYARGEAALLVTQLLEALVRNCRYLCALGMHTQA